MKPTSAGRPSYLLLLVFLLPLAAGLGGVAYTSLELKRMHQIRGWEPGAAVRSGKVHDTWVDERADEDLRVFWLTLTPEDITRPGDHRMSLPEHVWARYREGDEIEVVYLPGDPSPYHRDDFYAEDGNIALQLLLRAVAMGLGVISLLMAVTMFYVIRRVRRQRLRAG